MRFVMIALAILGLLLVGASAYVMYVLSGGSERTSASLDVWQRGSEATQEIVIGNSLRLKVPKGFRANPWQYSPVMPKGETYAHAISDSVVEFRAGLGEYIDSGRGAWSARVIAEVAAPGAASLPALPLGWPGSERIGCMAETSGRRVRVIADPNVYNAAQCQKIADGALASMQPDDRNIAALYATRAKLLSAQPVNRKAAWDALEHYGFKPLPDADNTPVRHADGHILYLHADRNNAVIWFKVAVMDGVPFDAIREDLAVTKQMVRQANAVPGLLLTRRVDGELQRYKMALSVPPVEDPQSEQLLKPLLLQETADKTVLWRVASILDFANRGAGPVEEWLTDSGRMRKAQPPVWKRI
jgi:hypothetical protein